MKTNRSCTYVFLIVINSIGILQVNGQELVNAQQISAKPKKDYQVKLYVSQQFYADSRTFLLINGGRAQHTQSQYAIGNLSPALAINKSPKYFQEISIQGLNLTKENSNSYDSSGAIIESRSFSFFFSGTYEFNYLVRRDYRKKWLPYIGAAANPYLATSKKTSNNKQNEFGIDFSIVPRIIWNFRERWSLDINSPLSLLGFTSLVTKGTTPQNNQPYSNSYNFLSFNDFSSHYYRLRVGVALKI